MTHALFCAGGITSNTDGAGISGIQFSHIINYYSIINFC